MAKIFNLLFNLFSRKRRRMEQALDRELRYHVDRRVDDLKKSGINEDEARRAAAIEFGGMARVQEEVRDTWIWAWLDNRRGDVRYAART